MKLYHLYLADPTDDDMEIFDLKVDIKLEEKCLKFSTALKNNNYP